MSLLFSCSYLRDAEMQLLIPRNLYLPLLTRKIEAFFQVKLIVCQILHTHGILMAGFVAVQHVLPNAVNKGRHKAWFDYQGCPLKW
jgi:hypothetical protein